MVADRLPRTPHNTGQYAVPVLPDGFPLCAFFHIDAAEIAARRAFLGFSTQDECNLERIRQVMQVEADAIITEFYEHLSGFHPVKEYLADPEVLVRLRQTQKQYLLTLGQRADGLAYVEDRLRIGRAHERVSLDPKWYLGAYVKLFELIERRLAARHHGGSAAFLVTLQKIFTLDATLAVETYYQATMQRLETALQDLTEAKKSLEKIARQDALTKVHNRKHLMEALEAELRRSLRFHHPFSLLFIDADHFKQINDSYGHAFGDFVLKRLVAALRDVLRPADIIGRFGGEEFLVGLVETAADAAQQIAERLRLKVSETIFKFKGQQVLVTISIGLASLRDGSADIDRLIDSADHALYRAKEAGRNQVCANEQARS